MDSLSLQSGKKQHLAFSEKYMGPSHVTLFDQLNVMQFQLHSQVLPLLLAQPYLKRTQRPSIHPCRQLQDRYLVSRQGFSKSQVKKLKMIILVENLSPISFRADEMVRIEFVHASFQHFCLTLEYSNHIFLKVRHSHP